MGLGGLVYHGLDKRSIEFFFIDNGIKALTVAVLCLDDDGYRVFLRLLGIDRITIDVIAGNLASRILRTGLVLGITIRAIACILARNIPCHFPATLLDLAHLLLKLIHLPLLTAITATAVAGIAVIILVDVHPGLSELLL